MGMLSLADILLTDAQVSYKENRIIIYFKVNAEVNLAFKEHIQSLYNRFIKQETILVTIEEHSFESHIISLASAASPEEYVSDDLVANHRKIRFRPLALVHDNQLFTMGQPEV